MGKARRPQEQRISVSTQQVWKEADALLCNAFDARPPYRVRRLRGSADWLCFVTLDGCGRFTHEKSQLLLRPQSIALLPPGLPHDYAVAVPQHGQARWRFIWAHLLPGPGWAQAGLLDLPRHQTGILYQTIGPGVLWDTIQAMASQMFAVMHSPGLAERRSLGLRIMELLLCCAAEARRGAVAARDLRITQACALLAQPGQAIPPLGRVARAVGLSASRLAHAFRSELGQSPHAWAERSRMQHAANLVARTAEHIGVIAQMVGYADPYHFSHRFRACMGCSPRVWRKRHQRKGP